MKKISYLLLILFLLQINLFAGSKTDGTATGNILVSTVSTGTAPLIISSSTKVNNLNVDAVDGYHFNQSLVTTASVVFATMNATAVSANSYYLDGVYNDIIIAVPSYNTNLVIGNGAKNTTTAQYLTIAGYNAGKSLSDTNGNYNTLFGYSVGASLNIGQRNTFIGSNAGASANNSADYVLVGYNAGKNLITGAGGVFIGSGAGENNQSGGLFIGFNAGKYSYNNNFIIGDMPLPVDNTAANNTFIGSVGSNSTISSALGNILIGKNIHRKIGAAQYNVMVGYDLCYGNNSTSSSNMNNVVIGYNSATYMPGNNNIIIGNQAGYINSISDENIIMGSSAAYNATNSLNNIFIGKLTGRNFTSNTNTVIGFQAGGTGAAIANNTFLGANAGYKNTDGQNTFLGTNAGYNTLGGYNICIGYNAGYNETGSSKLYISNSNTATPLIGGDFSAGTLSFNTTTINVTGNIKIVTGNIVLNTTTSDIYSVPWTDYSATSTVVGWEASPTVKIYYKKIGKLVYVKFQISGTSNSATTTFTVPYPYSSTNPPIDFGWGRGIDNGGTTNICGFYVQTGISPYLVELFYGVNLNNFTNSGNKVVYGSLWYESVQ